MHDNLEKMALIMQSALEQLGNFIECHALNEEMAEELTEIYEQIDLAFRGLLSEIL